MAKASSEMRSGGQTSYTVSSWACCHSEEFMKFVLTFIAFFAVLCAGPSRADAAARLKELVSIEGVRDNQLVGYGLVVGLAGTGDRQQTLFPAQSLANMLSRMGVTVDPTA